jgi:hypothetical protein
MKIASIVRRAIFTLISFINVAIGILAGDLLLYSHFGEVQSIGLYLHAALALPYTAKGAVAKEGG